LTGHRFFHRPNRRSSKKMPCDACHRRATWDIDSFINTAAGGQSKAVRMMAPNAGTAGRGEQCNE
jgi:hypothetical protein